MAERQKRKLPK